MHVTMDQAAEATAELVGSEWTRRARFRIRPAPGVLSADIVATTENGEPVVSVIHIEDRRHWNLVVMTDFDHRNPQCVTVKGYNLADALMGTDATFPDVADGTQLHVIDHPLGEWLLGVEVLEPART